ncbi:hypothetical protein DFH01_04800 [Falsiroseomonas bella]|uniref:Uncharacterized protein n=1 Tax=Falsiroseomonas bella TaxID=2184016 RepID=A0A317FKG9_9PROT|nr:hypothetical protein [Falsiroseomonas bella]PWS38597.1 hypothetical protein DFH01_04800 [Falsiroseomonas bella]
MRTPTARRALLAAIAPIPLIVACGTQDPAPRNTALRPPAPDLSASEPAPMPSEAANDFVAARRAGLAPAASGPEAMPGFGASQRIGTDMTTAPVPTDPIRRPQ